MASIETWKYQSIREHSKSEVKESAIIQRWIRPESHCHFCQFDFEMNDKYIVAALTDSGVYVFHECCYHSAIKDSLVPR